MKTCSKCKIEKPRSEFGKYSKSSDGLRCACKNCRSVESAAYRSNNKDRCLGSTKKWREENPDSVRVSRLATKARNMNKLVELYGDAMRLTDALKTCSKCGVEKQASDFNKHALGKDGLKSSCKKCEAEYGYARYSKFPEKIAASCDRWRRSNMETFRGYVRNRRARKVASGRLSSGLIERLLREQNGACLYCGADLFVVERHLDHRMPLKLGGTNTDDNMQLLCRSCNCRKSAKHPEIYEKEIGYSRQSGAARANPRL